MIPRRSPVWRIGFFLRDFLPENNLQLLFPLGTFLLLLGWEYWEWFPPRYSRAFTIIAGSIVRLAVRFAYTASVVLWCAAVRKPIRKFFWWVLLPIVSGVLSATVLFLTWRDSTVSFLEPELEVVLRHVRSLPSLLARPGMGAYLTLLGLAVLAVSLWAVRTARMSLPLRFQKVVGQANDSSSLSQPFFTVVIVSLVLVTLFEFLAGYAIAISPPDRLPLIFRWPRQLPACEWFSMLLGPAVALLCALVVFRKDQITELRRTASITWRGYIVAALLPLAISILPRVLVIIFRNVIFSVSGVRFAGFPPEWSDLFFSEPASRVLLIYAVACLEESLLRVVLQERFEARFGFKRGTLLVALSWWILGFYNGFGPIPSLRIPIPGVSTVVSLSVYMLYNIPLGWLYARTRSIWPVALMHGTMLLFRAGDGAYNIYLNFPYLYWIETAAWVFIAWFLFKKYPVGRNEIATEPASA